MKKKNLCRSPGCTTLTRAVRGYCIEHHRTAFACLLSGCPNRVSANSFYGFCHEHYNIGPKTKPVP